MTLLIRGFWFGCSGIEHLSHRRLSLITDFCRLPNIRMGPILQSRERFFFSFSRLTRSRAIGQGLVLPKQTGEDSSLIPSQPFPPCEGGGLEQSLVRFVKWSWTHVQADQGLQSPFTKNSIYCFNLIYQIHLMIQMSQS